MMSPNPQGPFSEFSRRARGRYDVAIANVRAETEKAAGRLTRGKKPVRTVSRYGVKLSGVTHRTANKLWKQQTKLVESQIDALADHLKAAARAGSLKELLRSQVDRIPTHTARLADEAREALSTFKTAGVEVRGLVAEAVDELRGKTKPRPIRRHTVRPTPATGQTPAQRAA